MQVVFVLPCIKRRGLHEWMWPTSVVGGSSRLLNEAKTPGIDANKEVAHTFAARDESQGATAVHSRLSTASSV